MRLRGHGPAGTKGAEGLMCSTRHHPHTPYSTVPCTPLDDHAYRMLAIRYYDQFTFSGHPLQSLSTPPPPPPQCCTPWGCVHHMQHRLHRSMRPSCVRGTPVVSPSLLIRVQSAPTVHPLSGIHHIVDNTYPHPPRVCAPPRAHRPPSDAGPPPRSLGLLERCAAQAEEAGIITEADFLLFTPEELVSIDFKVGHVRKIFATLEARNRRRPSMANIT